MSDLYDDADVETLAELLCDGTAGGHSYGPEMWSEMAEGGDGRFLAIDDARTILHAVAPAIAARALREFAETLLAPTPGYLSDGGTCRYFYGVATAAADEIERATP